MRPTQTPPAHGVIPSIRLISATPSSSSFDSMPTPWEAAPPMPVLPPSVLAPKASSSSLKGNHKRLIPKKSKLSMLGIGSTKERGEDLSDVARRVGSTKTKGGFEIYVDPMDDLDVGEIVVIKKKKSRAALEGMGWGPGPTANSGGVLGEVTNVSGGINVGKKEKDSGLLKVKGDDERKWWSIGRGRKEDKKADSKNQNRENPRSQTPDPFKPASQQQDSQRTRFNSLDAGMLLGLSSKKSSVPPPAAPQAPSIRISEPLVKPEKRSSGPALGFPQEQQRSATPVMGGLLAPPNGGGLAVPPANASGANQGSIALRAIKSVRSLARIGSWAQLSKGETGDKENTGSKKDGKKSVREKGKSKDGKSKEGKVKDGKSKDSKKSSKSAMKDNATLRLSTSSFEAGALTSSPQPPPKRAASLSASSALLSQPNSSAALNSATVTSRSVSLDPPSAQDFLKPAAPAAATVGKKRSILGLGLPSTMRLPSIGVRQGSSASSVLSTSTSGSVPPADANRLSVDSIAGAGVLANGACAGRSRSASVQSSGSSLRPMSITSTISGASTASSGASAVSVRWDEDDIAKERARVERERTVDGRRASGESRDSRESRHSAEGRRRTPLSAVFPGVQTKRNSEEEKRWKYPILTIEEATADGHGEDLDEVLVDDESEEGGDSASAIVATPAKKPRARPLSEQLLGRSRPKAFHEDDDGVLSILSAATNDLAQLINNLDLEATPATPDMTPLKPSLSPFNSEPSGSMTRSMSLQYTGSPRSSKATAGLSGSTNTITATTRALSTGSGSPAGKGVTVRSSVASISSLRPYAQSRGNLNGSAGAEKDMTTAAATLRAKASLMNMVPAWPLPKPAPTTATMPKLKASASPRKVRAQAQLTPESTPSMFTKTHKRTMTPAPEPDPAPVFQPLRPPKSRLGLRVKLSTSTSPARVLDAFCEAEDENGEKFRTIRANTTASTMTSVQAVKGPSELTFGSVGNSTVAPTKGSSGSKRSKGSKRSSSSSTSSASSRSCGSSFGGLVKRSHAALEDVEESRVPITREARRILGMSGTMGGSDVSAYQVEIDESDPDSDVPEELRFILKKDDADTISYRGVLMLHDDDDEDDDDDDDVELGRNRMEEEEEMTLDMELPRSVSISPPQIPMFRNSISDPAQIQQAQRLPVFRAQLITDTTSHDASFGEDDCFTSSDGDADADENGTKRSFDFTGELKKLNESGGSDRRSFVEQLESAFKTPAKMGLDLRCDFGITIGSVPPVPSLPARLSASGSKTSPAALVVGAEAGEDEAKEEGSMPGLADMDVDASHEMTSKSDSGFEAMYPISMIADTHEPSMDLVSTLESLSPPSSQQLKLKSSTMSAASGKSGLSDGELNRSFRFGGLSSVSPSPARTIGEADKTNKDAQGDKQMTLSDIIPPASHIREISFTSSMLDEYEDSGLKSLLAKATDPPQANTAPPARVPQQTINTAAQVEEAQVHKRGQSNRMSFIPLTRPSSGVSFAGLDSFDEVRRGFEFHDYRPAFYPPPPTSAATHAYPSAATVGAPRGAHRRAQESVFSIASVSSYGRVLRDGAPDPFDYGVPLPPMPSLRERSFEDSDAEMTDSMSFEMSTRVDDTFSFLHHRPTARHRVDSDASSFYFQAPGGVKGHRRRESNFSVSSMQGMGMPPVSLYNRGGFGYQQHRRDDSNTSASSVALSYAMHGAVGGRAILARHRREASMDSMCSDFSMNMRQLGRPGLGDKMFDTEFGAGPLAAIAGSPSGSISERDLLPSSMDQGNRTSSSSFDYYDSILDSRDDERNHHRDTVASDGYDNDQDDERRSSMGDSLFDQTGADRTSSVSSGSVFGDDDPQRPHGGLLPPHQFRPLSVFSIPSAHSPMKDDDTMISMLGGGHVRRRSIGSMIEASPCVRMEKKKPRHRTTAKMVYQGTQLVRTDADGNEIPSPKKGKLGIAPKPSIASTSSFQFGDERMIKATHGLLERQSLEDSCLVAAGEDTSHSFRAVPVFSRPAPASRSRSSTCTSASESSGRDTPPLSASDGSSISGGSMSSIDLAELNFMLSNTTHPVSTLASARARARGHGHRRRYSKAHMSRSSVYETIEEESNASSSESCSPDRSILASVTKKFGAAGDSPTACQGTVYVVEPDTESIDTPEQSVWDDDRGLVALRRYFTLKDEVQTTVMESQRVWQDTPFSIFAVQSFDPPRHPDGMKAMLEHSVHTFGPLPAELRRLRSRKDSRPSPYPQTRVFMAPASTPPFEQVRQSHAFETQVSPATKTPVLKQIHGNSNIELSAVPSLSALKPMSPFILNITDQSGKKEKAAKTSSNGFVRPRVASSTRRSALGWTKRSNGAKTSTDKKENVIGQGTVVTPGETLRINRPRPRTSRTPASQNRSIRI